MNRSIASRLGILVCEKFRRQSANNFPLLGAGVLRLVNQNVIYVAIDFVKHPRQIIPQKFQGRDDHVVVVNEVLLRFVFDEFFDERVQHDEKRDVDFRCDQLVFFF